MKTFLWTTLFWILAVIAGLICLGFGNIPGTPVVDNLWIAKFIPANIDDSIGARYVENYQCPEIEDVVEPEIVNDESEPVEENTLQDVVNALTTLSDNQGIIYNDMSNAVAQLQQMISDLAVVCSTQSASDEVKPIVDEKEQKRLEIQAQIEALQAQMQTL